MPQRNREKIVYGGPQGDDAFVKLRMPTTEEINAFQRISAEQSGTLDELESAAREHIAKFILEWNYVDDDGAPLPQPHNNPDVFEQILGVEFQHIYAAWLGKDTATKAAKKK
jgi:hypothetical protein